MGLKRPAAVLLAVSAIIVICIYAIYDPAGSEWFPKCPLYTVTGFKCPGCGSQRAIHALLHGDLATAFKMNGLLVISIPFILLLSYSEITRKRHPKLYVRVHSTYVIYSVLAIVIIWWITRNVIGI